MSLAELTPTQRELQQQHIERRLRIAASARTDRPINLKFKNGVVPEIAVDKSNKTCEYIQPIEIINETAPVILRRNWLFVSSAQHRINKTPPGFVSHIKKIVALQFGVSLEDIDDDRRSPSLVIPRHVAIYLAKTLTLHSYPEIGRKFGHRNHATIWHAADKMPIRMKADAILCQAVAELQDRFEREISEWRLESQKP